MYQRRRLRRNSLIGTATLSTEQILTEFSIQGTMNKKAKNHSRWISKTVKIHFDSLSKEIKQKLKRGTSIRTLYDKTPMAIHFRASFVDCKNNIKPSIGMSTSSNVTTVAMRHQQSTAVDDRLPDARRSVSAAYFTRHITQY